MFAQQTAEGRLSQTTFTGAVALFEDRRRPTARLHQRKPETEPWSGVHPRPPLLRVKDPLELWNAHLRTACQPFVPIWIDTSALAPAKSAAGLPWIVRVTGNVGTPEPELAMGVIWDTTALNGIRAPAGVTTAC